MNINKITIKTEITYETELGVFKVIVNDDYSSQLYDENWDIIREYQGKDIDDAVMNQNSFLDNYLWMWDI